MREQTENQEIRLPELSEKGVSLSLKREDLIHPLISGNKFRKLKYNLLEAKFQNLDTLLTFGGPFSNHIAATAYTGKKEGFKTIGIIRGDEIEKKWNTNPTLKQAHENGMQFKFISREKYRSKENAFFLEELKDRFGPFYLIPEGGTNPLAIRGCEEILHAGDADFEVVCCSVGTGGTLSGIINSSHASQEVLGFLALKGDFLKEDICKFAQKDNWELLTEYHFGGYAKVTPSLIHFINDFKSQTQIPLDPIYTGKLMFGILDLVKKDRFPPGTRILGIHTGGLQGIAGMNEKLKKKNLPLISV